MHMADALVSVPIAASFWAISGSLVAWSARRLRHVLDDRAIPFMGVLGAFIFASQMINFTIPFTGSSGHLGGGLILALLLGPQAAYLALVSVLAIQALLFADGGLLAMGCNIFNLAFFPSFVAAPLLYPLLGGDRSGSRHWLACVVCAVTGSLFGATGVTLQTVASCRVELPLSSFLPLMLSIHAVIGLVEGLATAAVVSFIRQHQVGPLTYPAPTQVKMEAVIVTCLVTLVTTCLISAYASRQPDGLEWSLKRAGISEQTTPAGLVHGAADHLQKQVAAFPNYQTQSHEPRVGTSLSGLLGGVLTLIVVVGTGFLVRIRRQRDSV